MKANKQLFIGGIICIAISLLIYCIMAELDGSAYTELSLLNFVIAIVFMLLTTFFWLPREERKKARRYNRKPRLIFLILLSISCLSINYWIPIFSVFPTWVLTVFFITLISLFLLGFHENLPVSVKITNMLVAGMSTVFVLYFVIFLLPYLIIGLVGIFFFGLTIHFFVPLLLLVAFIALFVKLAKPLTEKIAYFSGMAFSILVVIFTLIRFNEVKKLIESSNESLISETYSDLPTWVELCRNLPDGAMIEKILKGDFQYDTPRNGSWMWNNISFNSYSDSKMHDPLIWLGQVLTKGLSVDEDTRTKVLKARYNDRHKSDWKLWSGKNLSIDQILTNIRVYPDYRIAYTEKYFYIKNNHSRSWSQQEALFSFYLPEGSVASALSLWINGKEEKSVLTTKSKADSAYKRVVGVEVHDPSVMHWQEGNRISARVFPCTPVKTRLFKIGITTPLEFNDNNLILSNISYNGPSDSEANETLKIIFVYDNNLEITNFPKEFVRKGEKNFEYKGDCFNNWKIMLKVPPLSGKHFSFNGKSYSMSSGKSRSASIYPKQIYLDINRSWTKQEYLNVLETCKNYDLYVFTDALVKIDEYNSNDLYEELSQYQFSLFPLFRINPENSLLISKSTTNSPNLKELESSEFGINLLRFLSENKNPVYLINLSSILSPYLKTLKEFGVFNYIETEPDGIKEIIETRKFPVVTTNEKTVYIAPSKVFIRRDTLKSSDSAPDHLLRLFAYNQLIKKTGRNYFTEEKGITDELISIANEAFIVSPVSSLIVLETQQDYERFNIEKNKNSLANAQIQKSGAIPEPHEWVLIIFTLLIITFFVMKKRNYKLRLK